MYNDNKRAILFYSNKLVNIKVEETGRGKGGLALYQHCTVQLRVSKAMKPIYLLRPSSHCDTVQVMLGWSGCLLVHWFVEENMNGSLVKGFYL